MQVFQPFLVLSVILSANTNHPEKTYLKKQDYSSDMPTLGMVMLSIYMTISNIWGSHNCLKFFHSNYLMHEPLRRGAKSGRGQGSASTLSHEGCGALDTHIYQRETGTRAPIQAVLREPVPQTFDG